MSGEIVGEMQEGVSLAGRVSSGDIKCPLLSLSLYFAPRLSVCLCNRQEKCLCVKKAAETVALRSVSCHLWPPSNAAQTIFVSQTGRRHTDS